MRRPVVKEELVHYMRTRQKQTTGFLAELEQFARQENIPIIQPEVVAYFRFYCKAYSQNTFWRLAQPLVFLRF